LLFNAKEMSVTRKVLALSNVFSVERNSDILLKEKNRLTLEFRSIKNKFQITLLLGEVKNSDEEFKKSFLRGVFLGCGILSAPSSYHIEMKLEKDMERNFVSKILKQFDVRHSTRSSKIYVSGRENIKKFLYLIGSSSVFLVLEEDAVEKTLSNEINRRTNFEYANLKRQSDASTKQVEILEKLKENGKLDKLRSDLKEVAFLRLEYPYVSLAELSRLSQNYFSKQAIYYRLRRIIKRYEE